MYIYINLNYLFYQSKIYRYAFVISLRYLGEFIVIRDITILYSCSFVSKRDICLLLSNAEERNELYIHGYICLTYCVTRCIK